MRRTVGEREIVSWHCDLDVQGGLAQLLVVSSVWPDSPNQARLSRCLLLRRPLRTSKAPRTPLTRGSIQRPRP